MTKFLFATMPFDGHFNPLTGIAMHLHRQGHDVRWYAGPSYAPKLRALGIPHYSFERAREINGENIGEVFPERAKLSGPKLISFEMTNIFVANCGAHFADIAAIRDEYPFEAFVCDEALFASKLVSEKIGVPVYAVGLGPITANSREAPPHFFGLRPARSFIGRLRDRAVRAMTDSTMKTGLRIYNELLQSEGLEPLDAPRDFFDIPTDASTCFFQSGVPGFEYPRSDMPPCLKFVGALHPHRRSIETPFSGWEAVDAHESVVVVSQGTVDNKAPEKLIEPALQALSGTRHLVIATTGGVGTASLRERFPGANILIEDYVDFDRLFDRGDLFICNGGYGSVMLALSKGLPVLAAGVREGKERHQCADRALRPWNRPAHGNSKAKADCRWGRANPS